MSSIIDTKSNIEIALFEFLKTKTDKSEKEILKLSKKFLEQIESKLHKSQLPSAILTNLENVEHNQPIYLKGINFVFFAIVLDLIDLVFFDFLWL